MLKRDIILTCDRSELPSVTASLLNIRNTRHGAGKKHNCVVGRDNALTIKFVKDVVKLAQKLRNNSPQTFLKIIYEVSFAPNIGTKQNSNKHLNALKFVYDIAEADLTNGSLPSNHSVMIDTSTNILQMALEQVLILPIQPIEIVQFLHKNSSALSNDATSKKTNLDLFILDCRDQGDFDKSHFAQSFNLYPKLLDGSDMELLESVMQSFKCMDGQDGQKHFVFLSSPNDTLTVTKFVLLFLQKGFRYLSVCLEGYGQCKTLLMRNGQTDNGLIISSPQRIWCHQ